MGQTDDVHVPEDSVVEWVDRAPTGVGSLNGLTVAAKEIFKVGDCVRRTGTTILLPGRASADAAAVARLRAAGARLTARSASHEFAWGITNRRADGSGTENPLLPGRVSGGSSGGSAALVAAGVVDIGLGSDTAGSCRIPAAFCGIVGWKASNGAVPLDGCLPLAPAYDCGGLMAASIDVLRKGAGVLIGSSAGSRTVGTRVAVLDPELWPLVDPQRNAAYEALVSRFGARPVAQFPGPADLFAAFGVLQAQEVLRAHRAIGLWPSLLDQYPMFVRERLVAAEQTPAERISWAAGVQDAARAACDLLWETADVLLTVLPCGPSSANTPDSIEMPGGQHLLREVLVPWTCLANMVGAPAVVAPVGVDATGAPIVVQLMSAPGTDRGLIDRLGSWFDDSVAPRE